MEIADFIIKFIVVFVGIRIAQHYAVKPYKKEVKELKAQIKKLQDEKCNGI